MKKILFLTLVLVLIPALAFAGQDNASKFCTGADDFGISHGACVSTVQACTAASDGLTITPLCVCKFLRAAFPAEYQDIVGNNGLGACIQYIKDIL
jgi:hypothetical protein